MDEAGGVDGHKLSSQDPKDVRTGLEGLDIKEDKKG